MIIYSVCNIIHFYYSFISFFPYYINVFVSICLCLGFALEMKHRIINPEHETLLWENENKEIHENKEDVSINILTNIHKHTHIHTEIERSNENNNSIEVLG